MKFNFIDRVKLPFRKDKELYSSLYRILGFYPRNIEIYRTAFAHKSLSYRNKKGTAVNNERLEFLGDAVLEAAVSDILYTHFPNKREGFLTSTRSKLVQRDTLNQLAAEMGVERLIKHSFHSNAHNNYVGGNAFEALIGAIYLDRGYAACKWFISKRILGKVLDIDGVAHKEVNFKSKLLEWCQKNRVKVEFKMRDRVTSNPDDPQFDTVVIIETLEAGFGKGFSKKESHQNAAREALLKIRKEQSFVSKIFKVKEKRTAMETEMCVAPPAIEELDMPTEQISGKQEKAKPGLEAHVQKPARRRRRSAKDEDPKPMESEQTVGKSGEEPKNPRKDTKKHRKEETKPDKQADASDKDVESPIETAEKKTSRRRRKPGAKKQNAGETGKEPQSRPSEEVQREALISAADDLAFEA